MLQGWPRSAPRLPQAAQFPQTRAGSSREFCVIWAGQRRAEKEGLGGLILEAHRRKTKQDVLEPDLVYYSPPLLPQLRGRRQRDTSQPESGRKLRKSSGGTQPTASHRTGRDLQSDRALQSAGVNFNQFQTHRLLQLHEDRSTQTIRKSLYYTR